MHVTVILHVEHLSCCKYGHTVNGTLLYKNVLKAIKTMLPTWMRFDCLWCSLCYSYRVRFVVSAPFRSWDIKRHHGWHSWEDIILGTITHYQTPRDTKKCHIRRHRDTFFCYKAACLESSQNWLYLFTEVKALEPSAYMIKDGSNFHIQCMIYLWSQIIPICVEVMDEREDTFKPSDQKLHGWKRGQPGNVSTYTCTSDEGRTTNYSNSQLQPERFAVYRSGLHFLQYCKNWSMPGTAWERGCQFLQFPDLTREVWEWEQSYSFTSPHPQPHPVLQV